MSDADAKDVPDNAQDLTIFVQNLLEQMQQRFNQMSSAIIGRIDEVGLLFKFYFFNILDLIASHQPFFLYCSFLSIYASYLVLIDDLKILFYFILLFCRL